MKTPITIVIPLVLVVSSMVTSFIMYQQNIETTDKTIRNYALQELKLDITRLQNILYNLLTENNIADARLNLSVTAMKPEIQVLVLTNEANKVIAANRYMWIDHNVKEVIDYNNKIADEVKLNNRPSIFFDKNKKHLLKGYYPVVLQLGTKSNLSEKKSGVLFAELDIKSKLVNAKNKALEQSVVFAGSMLLTSILVALLLHYLIVRRLKILALASDNIASGHYEISIPTSGNDEITQLAESYNQMAHQINEAFSLREKTKKELELLNATLEKRINDRTALLKQAQHLAKMGNWVWYVEDDSLYWSDEVYKMCGVELGHFVLTIDGFLSVVHPDDISKIEAGIEEAFVKNENYVIEHRIVLPDDTVRWVREEAIPEIDKNGKRIKMTGIIRDITEEKLSIKEKEKLELELQQMQKMESLGQLTGGIAHDFNNMLAIILGYNELAQTLASKNNDEKLSAYLEQIAMSSKRASELVQQMLAFSRVDDGFDKKENLSLNKLLSETGAMLKPILSSNTILNIADMNKEYTVNADAVMLNQIIVNLCINAKGAMPGGQGHIDIAVSNVTMDGTNCSSCFNTISGEFIQLEVKDNGSGMPKEALQRIFEPFYTTKEVGEGTGMGLAMVHGIMHKHQGHIIVDSKEGYGSTFKLLFPLTKEETQAETIKKLSSDIDADKNEGNILIVDDEQAVALFLNVFLEEKGYTTTVINDSKEALAYFIKNNESIDLVITDYTMPGMTGIQLAEYMVTNKPDTPIILCSGYIEDFDKNKVKNIKSYIEKPVNTKLLLSEIKKYICTTKKAS